MAKEVFVGTFVHSLSLEQLEIGEKGAIGVEHGKIVFVEKNVADVEAVKKVHGFEGAEVLQNRKETKLTKQTTSWIGPKFLIPGFVDCHIVCPPGFCFTH